MNRRKRALNDLDRDIREHLRHEIDDNIDRGMSPAEARRQALLKFGNTALVKEDTYSVWGAVWLDTLRGDLRYALRQLGRSPVLSTIVVLILAVGIGAGTAVFSEIHDLVWKTLPVREPEALRWVLWRSEEPGFRVRGNYYALTPGYDSSFSYPAYRRLRDSSRSFSDVVAFEGMQTLNVGIGTSAESAGGQFVSGNYFEALGVQAEAGRLLLSDDDRRNAPPVAVIGHAFWQRIFGGDPAVIGRIVRVNNAPVEIVGVMPPDFHSLEPQRWHPDLVLPMSLQPVLRPDRNLLDDPGDWSVIVFGRLRSGVADEQAQAETQTLLRQAIREASPEQAYTPPDVTLIPGARGLGRADDLPFSLALGGAVGFILLIGCANVAGLLLVRASGRRHEIGTRLALGAGRRRLIRQLLTESMLLSLLGGAAGVAAASLLSDSVASAGMPILVFAILLMSGTGIAFGLAPALVATRGAVIATLKKASPQIGNSRSRGGPALVSLQVALSLALLVSSGLFFRTLSNLTRQPLGFLPDNLLIFRVDPSLNGYAERGISDYFQTALNRIESLPGVESASLSRWGMLTFGSSGERVCIESKEPRGAATHSVAPRFFETAGVPLHQGRDFTWDDRENSSRVAIVNEAFSRRYYGGESPIGRSIRMGCRPGTDGQEARIVGVAGDSKYASLRGPAPETVFIPYRQSRERWMTFVVRTAASPAGMIPAVRAAIAEIDPNIAIYDLATQSQWIELNVARERRLANLVSIFGGVALLLSAMGIYGTLAHLVAQRTPEIGLRIALGARSQEMAAMVVRRALLPVGIGIALGLLASAASTRLIATMLFDVSPGDPLIILSAVSCLAIAAAPAVFLPARRAARIDPLAALRHE